MNEIATFFSSLILQDYILIVLSFAFAWFFVYIGIERVYKSYLGVILWLFVFSFVNLSLFSLNADQNILWVEFFMKHKDYIWLYALSFIPLFAFMIPLNGNIAFRISDKKRFNYFLSFVFWLLYLSFLICILLSVVNNKFLFRIDNELIIHLREKDFVKDFIAFYSPSSIYQFLSNNDTSINTITTLFIFYKMTIGWVVDYLLFRIFSVLKDYFEIQSNRWEAKHQDDHQPSHHQDDHHDEEEDDDHGHDHHDDHHWHGHH